MRLLLAPLVLAAAFLGGCDADCDDPGRIDGHYAVWSNATSDDVTVTGFDDDNDPDRVAVVSAIFANGWSEWDFKYVPSQDGFNLTIDGQTYSATYEQDDTNCNAFDLAFGGPYESDADAKHTFDWKGRLAYMGSHVTGTYEYSDSWTRSGSSGTIVISEGEFRADLRKDDTGF